MYKSIIYQPFKIRSKMETTEKVRFVSLGKKNIRILFTVVFLVDSLNIKNSFWNLENYFIFFIKFFNFLYKNIFLQKFTFFKINFFDFLPLI